MPKDWGIDDIADLTTGLGAATVEKLSLILLRERELLDTLLYRLEVEQLVLASGRTTHLMRAARDVEACLDTLRQTEVLRSVAADEAAEEVGVHRQCSLRELAEAAAEPWRTILLEHREAFVEITRQVSEMAGTNRDLITSGWRSAQETLHALDDAAESYSPDGTAVATTPTNRLLDRSL